MAENAIRATVTGNVQGVSFRDYVKSQGAERHVRGWVRNAEGGAVEAVLAGEALDLEAMVQALHEGPDGAKVEDVKTEPADTSEVLGCKDVEIRD